ncbi:hypothetical protein ACQP3J_26835 [Escherichia coli]
MAAGRAGARSAAEILHVETKAIRQRDRHRELEMPWVFEISKPTQQHIFSKNATPPKPSQTAPPTGEQVFDCLRLGTFVTQTTFHFPVSGYSWSHHNTKYLTPTPKIPIVVNILEEV